MLFLAHIGRFHFHLDKRLWETYQIQVKSFDRTMIEYLDWNDRRVCYCFTLDVSSESFFVVLCRRASFRSFKLPPDSLVMKNILWAHSIDCDYCLAPKNKRQRQKIFATPKQRERKRKKLHNFIIFVVRLHNDAHTSLWISGGQLNWPGNKRQRWMLYRWCYGVLFNTQFYYESIFWKIYTTWISSHFYWPIARPKLSTMLLFFLFWNARYSDQLQ